MSPALTQSKTVIRISLLLTALAIAGSLLFGRPDWALGMALGAAVAILNFYLLFRDLAKAAEPPKAMPLGWNARAFTARFLMRYLLLIAAFFLAFRSRWIHFLSFVLGFSILQVNLGVQSLRELGSLRGK